MKGRARVRTGPATLLALVTGASLIATFAAARAGSAILRTVATIPLPGGTGRFDYQSLDTSTGRLYVAHMGPGRLLVVDTRTRTVVADLDGFPRATGVCAVPALGRVYVSTPGRHSVAVIDANTLTVRARLGDIGFPDGIADAPRQGKIYVSDEAGGGELVIDGRRDRIVTTIALGGEAGNTTYDRGSGQIIVAGQTRNELVEIDPATDRIAGRIALPGAATPHGLVIDAIRRRAFVACQGTATLLVVDLDAKRVLSRERVGEDPDVLAFDPGWRRLYVAAESGVVSVFEERGRGLVRLGEMTMPAAHSVAVDPASHLVYFPLRNVAGHPVLRVMAGTPPAAPGTRPAKERRRK